MRSCFRILSSCSLLAASALVGGCASRTVTLEARIAGNPVAVRDAVRHAGQKLGYETETGTMRASIDVGGGFGRSGHLEMDDADAFLRTPDSGAFSSFTRAMGAVRVRGGRDSAHLDVIFGAAGGADAPAQAKLLVEAVRQELEIEAGKRKPVDNARKSVPGFVARNLLTPLWGEHYLLAGNPLVAGANRPAQYILPVLGEVAGWGNVVAGAMSESDESRSKYLSSGVLILVLYRGLLTCVGVQDVKDYNRIAASPYDLVRISF